MITNPNPGSSYKTSRQQVSCLPRRISLVDETVSALKISIRQGELTGALPGEMQLKKSLRIGRDTLRHALKVLTTEGWILPASKGRQRNVKIHSSGHKHRQYDEKLPVTFLSPPLGRKHNTCLEMKETQQQLRKHGVALRFVTSDILKLSQSQRRLEQFVNQYPSSGWVLHHTTQPIQRWFADKRLPALLYEAPFAGIDLPFIADDWEAAAFHAGVELIRGGHRHIGMLKSNQHKSKSLAAERGLKRALKRGNATKQMILLYEDGSPASVAETLERAVNLNRSLTALIMTEPVQIMVLYSWLVSRGIRVPDDLSVISLASDTWFTELFPKLSHYQTHFEAISYKISQRITDLAINGSVAAKSLYIPMTYNSGSTIGAPKQKY